MMGRHPEPLHSHAAVMAFLIHVTGAWLGTQLVASASPHEAHHVVDLLNGLAEGRRLEAGVNHGAHNAIEVPPVTEVPTPDGRRVSGNVTGGSQHSLRGKHCTGCRQGPTRLSRDDRSCGVCRRELPERPPPALC